VALSRPFCAPEQLERNWEHAVLMRVLIYGTLAVVAALLLADTNLGTSVGKYGRQAVSTAVAHLEKRGMTSDADVAGRLAASDGFRESKIYGYIVRLARSSDLDFSFYAYTPLLSRSRVFIGESFWDVGVVGRSSVLIHEIAHITRHQERLLGGFPRSADEAQAYRRQYLTYRAVGLSPSTDGIAYWNMMMGIYTYVLPTYPEYRYRPDVRLAMRELGLGD